MMKEVTDDMFNAMPSKTLFEDFCEAFHTDKVVWAGCGLIMRF